MAAKAKKEKKEKGSVISAAEIRGKTRDELVTLLTQFKKEQLNLRFQKTTGALTTPLRIREVRRNIAKIQTILSEIQIKEAANA